MILWNFGLTTSSIWPQMCNYETHTVTPPSLYPSFLSLSLPLTLSFPLLSSLVFLFFSIPSLSPLFLVLSASLPPSISLHLSPSCSYFCPLCPSSLSLSLSLPLSLSPSLSLSVSLSFFLSLSLSLTLSLSISLFLFLSLSHSLSHKTH